MSGVPPDASTRRYMYAPLAMASDGLCPSIEDLPIMRARSASRGRPDRRICSCWLLSRGASGLVAPDRHLGDGRNGGPHLRSVRSL